MAHEVADYKMLIGGEWKDSSDGRVIEVISPIDEQVIGHVPQGTRKDAVAALTTSQAAFKAWAQTPAVQRAEYLLALADGASGKEGGVRRILDSGAGEANRRGERRGRCRAPIHGIRRGPCEKTERRHLHFAKSRRAGLDTEGAAWRHGWHRALELPPVALREEIWKRPRVREYNDHQATLQSRP